MKNVIRLFAIILISTGFACSIEQAQEDAAACPPPGGAPGSTPGAPTTLTEGTATTTSSTPSCPPPATSEAAGSTTATNTSTATSTDTSTSTSSSTSTSTGTDTANAGPKKYEEELTECSFDDILFEDGSTFTSLEGATKKVMHAEGHVEGTEVVIECAFNGSIHDLVAGTYPSNYRQYSDSNRFECRDPDGRYQGYIDLIEINSDTITFDTDEDPDTGAKIGINWGKASGPTPDQRLFRTAAYDGTNGDSYSAWSSTEVIWDTVEGLGNQATLRGCARIVWGEDASVVYHFSIQQ